MRNWDRCSAGYGSRTFIIKGSNKYHMFSGAEGVGNATPVLFPDNDATKYDVMRGMFGLYHRDDVTQQMKHRINCSSKNEIVLVAAESGLMFVRYSAGIKVIEPITGVVVLTLNFPDWDCYNLEAPFSCFLS
ncbi:hypothetical protein Pelo_17734 [Pelomyxa schiedti]|nr:hypothetical protein Pelo_17734 [Pelomyxa schiedti]